MSTTHSCAWALPSSTKKKGKKQRQELSPSYSLDLFTHQFPPLPPGSVWSPVSHTVSEPALQVWSHCGRKLSLHPEGGTACPCLICNVIYPEAPSVRSVRTGWVRGNNASCLMPSSSVRQGQTLLVSMRKSWFWNIYLNPSLGQFSSFVMKLFASFEILSDDTILFFSLLEKLNYITLHTRNGLSIAGSILSLFHPTTHLLSHPNQPRWPAFTQRSSAGHSPVSKDVNKPRLKGTLFCAREAGWCLSQVNITYCRMRQPPAAMNRPWYPYFLGARETAELLILAYSLIRCL